MTFLPPIIIFLFAKECVLLSLRFIGRIITKSSDARQVNAFIHAVPAGLWASMRSLWKDLRNSLISKTGYLTAVLSWVKTADALS
jgi:hypothetical protein